MRVTAILVMWPGQFEKTKTFVPHPKESPYEMLVQLAKLFQRRCLKMLATGGRTDAGVIGILIGHLEPSAHVS